MKPTTTRPVVIDEIRPKIQLALENIAAERKLALADHIARFRTWYAGERTKWWRWGFFALAPLLTDEEVAAFLQTSKGAHFASDHGFRSYSYYTHRRWDGGSVWAGDFDASHSFSRLIKLLNLIDIATEERVVHLTVDDAWIIDKFSSWSGELAKEDTWPRK